MSGLATQIQGRVKAHSAGHINHGDRFFYLPFPASLHVSHETPRGYTLHPGFTGFIHKQKQPQEKL
jgi:hypothetical protein